MKAAVIHQFGDADVLKYEDIATPKPPPGHILVKVLAAGVNRLDDYLREGSVVPELPFPHILGADAAGEVFGLGKGVTGFEIGERVVAAERVDGQRQERHGIWSAAGERRQDQAATGPHLAVEQRRRSASAHREQRGEGQPRVIALGC
ncbi:MAG: zinc-binding alcohol dehydrogenase family protein [Pseudomonadota bacterium]|nr:zinc-binding alcohol dehydrogenase family protein [Pseudomonadota bacterium]